MFKQHDEPGSPNEGSCVYHEPESPHVGACLRAPNRQMRVMSVAKLLSDPPIPLMEAYLVLCHGSWHRNSLVLGSVCSGSVCWLGSWKCTACFLEVSVASDRLVLRSVPARSGRRVVAWLCYALTRSDLVADAAFLRHACFPGPAKPLC